VTLLSQSSWATPSIYPTDVSARYRSPVNTEITRRHLPRQVRVNQDHHKKAKDLDTRLEGDQQGGFDTELSTFGRDGLVLGPIVGAFGEMSSHVDHLADIIADVLTAEHLSYYGDRGSKTAKAYYHRVLYRAWGLTAHRAAHRGWARLMLDRRSLVQAPNARRGQSKHPVLATTTTKRSLTRVI